MSFNIIIKNGKIISGAANPWFSADIGVNKGRISKIGTLKAYDAEQVSDAEGLIVCPGFIDAHSHTDLVISFNRS